MLVRAAYPIVGVELPFPFVTVAHVPASEFVHRSRRSLIGAVLGGSPALLEDLIFDPTIDKIFCGDEFDRGYDPAEPHEGFLADFLFRKKVVSSYAD
jgi:thienamycin biosynthesis protein ThnO